MRKDKLVLGFRALKRPFEPLVLLVAERDRPPVAMLFLITMRFFAGIRVLTSEAAVHQSRRMPVIIEQDEKRITPSPRAVIFQKTNGVSRLAL